MCFVLSVYMYPLSRLFYWILEMWYLFVIHFVTFVLFVLDRMVVGFTTTYATSTQYNIML
jgi:hypothetical protein